MVKVNVALDFPSAEQYEEFVKKAHDLNMTCDEYLREIVSQNLAEMEGELNPVCREGRHNEADGFGLKNVTGIPGGVPVGDYLIEAIDHKGSVIPGGVHLCAKISEAHELAPRIAELHHAPHWRITKCMAIDRIPST